MLFKILEPWRPASVLPFFLPLGYTAFVQYFFDSGDPRGSNMLPSGLGKLNGIGYLLICGVALFWLAADQPALDKETFLLLGYFLCVTTALSMLERLYLLFIRE